MSELLFIPETHEYFLHGKRLLSVSEFIEPMETGINREIADELEAAFDNARERGTACHKALEMLLNGEQVFYEDFPDEYEPYLTAAVAFASDHEIVPCAIEKPIVSNEMGIAGTPDLLCELDGELALIDYKFVAQVDKPRVKAQLNTYRLMYEEQGVFIDGMYVIQFMKNGKYRKYPTAIDNRIVELCMAIKAEKNLKHRKGRID